MQNPRKYCLPMLLLNKSLYRKFKQGNIQAFEVLHKRFEKPIFRFISEKISNPDTAEELTQDVFMKAYRARESFEENFEFSTWLWTIAKNTTFDWLRKQKEEPLASLEDYTWEEIPCASPSPEARTRLKLDAKSNRRNLLKVMKSLTHLQKRALIMRVVRQLSYEEISKNLGLSISAAKCLVYRAKAAMQVAVGPGIHESLVWA
jgi:RNA polymerase sigma-70 factor (ECF subfamily)